MAKHVVDARGGENIISIIMVIGTRIIIVCRAKCDLGGNARMEYCLCDGCPWLCLCMFVNWPQGLLFRNGI